MTKHTKLSPAPTKEIRKSMLFSSSILAGVITLGTFTSAVEAQELDLDHDFLQSLYEEYTALSLNREDNPQPSLENLEDTDNVSNDLPEENLEELEYIKAELLRMIDLAGGESVLEQLDLEVLSLEQLDTIFNALIEQQLNNDESQKTQENQLDEETSLFAVQTLESADENEEEQIEEEKGLEAEEIAESKVTALTAAENESESIVEINDEIVEEVASETPVTETPEVEAPKQETPKEEVKQEAPEQEMPKEEVKEETPKQEAPKEEVKEETPKQEAPKEEVKEEAPKQETPKEAPKQETPKEEVKQEASKPKEEPKKEEPAKVDEKPIVYVVRSGDTLGKIAKKYNTTTAKLASLNKLANINRISVGQVLAINEAGVSESKTTQPTTPGNLNQTNTPAAFINQISGFAQEVASQNGVYASVMIAQASLESGYGRSSLSAPPNHNLFGIKGSYNGQSVAMQTREYYSHTGWITITDHFKKYPSYEESLNDNARLLRSGTSWNPLFYSGAWVEKTNSYRDATAWLQGRYATDPTYANKLNNLIQLYDLTRFDVPVSGGNKPSPVPTPAPNPAPVSPTNPFKETTTYTVARGDTLNKIAREFKTTVQALKSANHLTTDLIFVNQTLTVPKLESAQPAPETPSPVKPVETGSQSYTVASGDTLTQIARRFGTTVNAIRQANNLSSDLIFINQKLNVPTSASVETPVTPPAENAESQTRSITVQRGDTLSQLARTHNTTVAALKSVNNLQSDTIYVGQKLVVNSSVNEEVKPPVNDSSNETTKGTASYTVKSGDTLYRIARDYKTTVSNLRVLNNLQTDLIRVGTTLTVPSDKPSSVNEQKPAGEQQSTSFSYTVKSGDTLSKIARDHKTTVAKLLSDNTLTSDRIFIGQKLTVNGTEIKQDTPAGNQSPATQVDYVVKSGDTLSQIARNHNTTVNELMTLNDLTDSNRLSIGQRLVVTKGQAEQAKPAAPKPAPAQPASGSYTVKNGDTLSQIARAHDMTLAQLLDLNKLDNADRIFAGQQLALSSGPAVTPKPVTPAPAPEPVKTENSEYMVKSGDTLSQIARTHNMTLTQLRNLNTLENADRIFIGQRLVVSTEKAEAPKPVTPAPAPEPVKTENSEYMVKSGDTLSQIARTHNMTLAQLMELNKLENADRLSIGQRLVVSGENTQAPQPVTPVTTAAPASPDHTDYVVKSGDTLSQLARDFNVTLSQIKEWNKLTSDIIFVNQKLVFKQDTASKPVSSQTATEHTVSAGDTLSHIAKLYNISVRELKELNYLTSDLIFVDQKLSVVK